MTIYFIKETMTHKKCIRCGKRFQTGQPYTYDGQDKKGHYTFRHLECPLTKGKKQ